MCCVGGRTTDLNRTFFPQKTRFDCFSHVLLHSTTYAAHRPQDSAQCCSVSCLGPLYTATALHSRRAPTKRGRHHDVRLVEESAHTVGGVVAGGAPRVQQRAHAAGLRHEVQQALPLALRIRPAACGSAWEHRWNKNMPLSQPPSMTDTPYCAVRC